jgi:CubicO group peptidase (beta-lactamase class C family)
MTAVPIARPEAMGLDPTRLQRAYDLLHKWIDTDKVPAAGVCVGRNGMVLQPRLVGRQRPDGDVPLRQDALFLVASVTKPVTVTAVMLLVERGLLTLEDKVASFVPRFAAKDKGAIEVRHLMTHTSGLPDMVTDNTRLRAGHKPFSTFVEAVCQEPLLFPPGTKVSYQSMGTAMLGEIVHQVSGKTLPEFLRKEIFEPLGMSDTSLGWDPAKKERIAAVRIDAHALKTDWHWNSPYWLGFGAPWGGMITSPSDMARFCQMMLNGGKLGEVRILSPATIRTMTVNHLATMPQVPEDERRCRPWGLGWRLHWQGHSNNFGDLLGPRTFGHYGSTGTLVWIDPDTAAFLVLFTTQPQDPEGRFLSRLSNMIAAAMV